MSPTAHKIEAEFQSLDANEQANLLDRLISTVRHDDDALSPEWEAEIGRRIEDIESGREQGIPLEDALARLDKKFSK